MKTVIIEMAQSAPFFVRSGWAKVLRSIGWKVIEWWPEKQPCFDVFVGKIDLFIGTTYNFRRSLDKIVRKNPEMRVALFASAWGELTDNIDSALYPIVKVSKEEKGILGDLYNDVKKPDIVFIHITERHLQGSLGGWKTLGIPILGLLNAADLFVYYYATPDDKYIADVSFVGGNWKYKSQTLNKYIGRLADSEWKTINIKIYGNGWNCPQHLGALPIGQDANVFSSSKICPHVSEPHSYICDDLCERIMKIPAAGGFLICDNVNLEEVGLKDSVPQFSSYEEFLSLIKYYLNSEHDADRLALTNRQKSVILEKHTYHDRMNKLLNSLNLNEDAELILQRKKEILGEKYVR